MNLRGKKLKNCRVATRFCICYKYFAYLYLINKNTLKTPYIWSRPSREKVNNDLAAAILKIFTLGFWLKKKKKKVRTFFNVCRFLNFFDIYSEDFAFVFFMSFHKHSCLPQWLFKTIKLWRLLVFDNLFFGGKSCKMDVLCIRLNLILRTDLRAGRKVCLFSSKKSTEL